MHQGRRISIPVIEESSHEWKKLARIDGTDLQGRPSKVLKKFIDLGFAHGWWDSKIVESIIIFCWDRGYLKSDAQILALPFKFFLLDMDRKKKQRLKEVDENGG